MKLRKKHTIPRLIAIIVVLLVFMVVFYAWHDGRVLGREPVVEQVDPEQLKSLPINLVSTQVFETGELFLLSGEGQAYPYDLKRGCYPVITLRRSYFQGTQEWEYLKIVRYRSMQDLIGILQENGQEIPSVFESMALSASEGRRAVHRGAILELKLPVTLLLGLLAYLSFHFFVNRPLQRR